MKCFNRILVSINVICAVFLWVACSKSDEQHDTEKGYYRNSLPYAAPPISPMDWVTDALGIRLYNEAGMGSEMTYNHMEIVFSPEVLSPYTTEVYPTIFEFDLDNPEYYSFLRNLQHVMMKDKLKPYYYGWPEVLYGGVSETICITANERLFGKDPGENLVEFFSVYRVRRGNHYTFNYPEFTLKDVYDYGFAPVPLNTYYSSGTVLLVIATCIKMNSIPSEKYDSLELTIRIPVQTHTWAEYALDTEGKYVTPDERMLSGSVTIDFKNGRYASIPEDWWGDQYARRLFSKK